MECKRAYVFDMLDIFDILAPVESKTPSVFRHVRHFRHLSNHGMQQASCFPTCSTFSTLEQPLNAKNLLFSYIFDIFDIGTTMEGKKPRVFRHVRHVRHFCNHGVQKASCFLHVRHFRHLTMEWKKHCVFDIFDIGATMECKKHQEIRHVRHVRHFCNHGVQKTSCFRHVRHFRHLNNHVGMGRPWLFTCRKCRTCRKH